MMTSMIRQRASWASWMLLVGVLGAGCMTAESDPEAAATQGASDTGDLTSEESTNDVTRFEEASELIKDSGDTPLDPRAEADGTIEVAAPAPTCVVLSIDRPGIITKTVRLHNACGYRVRVRIDISFAPDLPCISMAVGQRNSWKVGRGAIIAGVKNC